jgi:Transposase IS66 family
MGLVLKRALKVATLMRLVDVIRTRVFAAERMHADDTTVPVLAKGKTRTGRLWTYVRDDRSFAGPDPPAAMWQSVRAAKSSSLLGGCLLLDHLKLLVVDEILRAIIDGEQQVARPCLGLCDPKLEIPYPVELSPTGGVIPAVGFDCPAW